MKQKNALFQKEDVAQVNAEDQLKVKRKIDFAEINSLNSTVSSSNSYGENLRQLYRSMNVAVPQRLPSLVRLREANKSARKI